MFCNYRLYTELKKNKQSQVSLTILKNGGKVITIPLIIIKMHCFHVWNILEH